MSSNFFFAPPQFHEAWEDLCRWLEANESVLNEDLIIPKNDPEKIKALLANHKDFQRALGAKQVRCQFSWLFREKGKIV